MYGLEIHERTPFGKNPQIRRWESEHQEQFEAMYLWATDRLEKAGLFQYELSNFFSVFFDQSIDSSYFVEYFEKYRNFLTNNTLNHFTKVVISHKF